MHPAFIDLCCIPNHTPTPGMNAGESGVAKVVLEEEDYTAGVCC